MPRLIKPEYYNRITMPIVKRKGKQKMAIRVGLNARLNADCERRTGREMMGNIKDNPGGLGRPPGLSQRRKVLLYSTTNELADRFTDSGRDLYANQPIFLTQSSISSGKPESIHTSTRSRQNKRLGGQLLHVDHGAEENSAGDQGKGSLEESRHVLRRSCANR